jgi:L-threonylcarbamoyladenylate synthase
VRIVPAGEGLAEAAERLRRGELVAFPTETVYGLGADARDADAVAKIFAAKGRPASNPLIVHVPDADAARALASDWTDAAGRLAAAFWPGPLTLVVARAAVIPDIVTAGGGTVGLRVPSHPVARELLARAGVPVAAPSANRSEEVSPTTAAHVAESLGPYVPDLMILDGGPCAVGIESTVVDVTGDAPGPARSPGQMARHYAPRKPLLLLDGVPPAPAPGDALLVLPDDPYAAAALLYAELRRLDADPTVRRVLAVSPPDTPEWTAVRDRLRRAATPAT